MSLDKKTYNILLIEDNPGDLLLIQEYLDEYLRNSFIDIATTLKEGKALLLSPEKKYDVILLDLDLPDSKGDSLIKVVLKLSKKTPIIVLTGYSDMPYILSVVKKGAYDYILKDQLNSFTLYKSILHNIDRHHHVEQLENSSKRNLNLFQLSPQPILVFNKKTYKIEEVNDAAITTYGYSRKEFLELSKNELYHEEDRNVLFEVTENEINLMQFKRTGFRGVFRHLKKNGEIIHVEVFTNDLGINKQNISVIYDVSDKIKHTSAIEEQNNKLKEIAWIQSHVVRAPLARMMGLIDLLSLSEDEVSDEVSYCLKEIIKSSVELDKIINDISNKTLMFNASAKAKPE
ncbi:response regulator [Thalassobellus suaedae]|uniref:Response regulator n=1 Tax=Thalassobellus suaedae TaxID=3074124 RepID=A0ABY9Y3J9_9FLAO|nr:response regulator [Flavobacteriaceae bacterium HL-DH10]